MPPIDVVEIVRRFTSHPLSPTAQAAQITIRADAASLAETIVKTTPESREQSLAITHLEEAVFWANAAIARNH